MQCRLLFKTTAEGVNKLRMRFEPKAQIIDLAPPCGIKNSVDRLHDIPRSGFPSLGIASQELERLELVCPGDLVDGAAVVIGCGRIETHRERAPDGLDVASVGRLEDAL